MTDDFVPVGSEQTAPGQDFIGKARQEGYSDDEIASIKNRLSNAQRDAGYKPSDIDKYWGDNDPDRTQMDRYITGNLARVDDATAGAKIASNPMEMARAGWDMSVAGLMTGRPAMVAPEHAGIFSKILYSGAQVLGDLPAAIPGMVAGTGVGAVVGSEVPVVGSVLGGVAGGGAGFNALPQAMREIMLDMYNRGQIHTYRDFMAVMGSSLLNVGKEALKGAIAAPAGFGAGKVVSKLVGEGAEALINSVTQALTYTAASGALDGKMPNAEDFASAAVLVGGFHMAAKFGLPPAGEIELSAAGKIVKANLQHVFRTYGIDPATTISLSDQDPELRQSLLAEDIHGQPAIDAFRKYAKFDQPGVQAPPVTLDMAAGPEDTFRGGRGRMPTNDSGGHYPNPNWMLEGPYRNEMVTRQLPSGQVVPDATSVASYLQKFGKLAGFKFQVGEPQREDFAGGPRDMSPAYQSSPKEGWGQIWIPDNAHIQNQRWYGLSTNEILFHEVGHALDQKLGLSSVRDRGGFADKGEYSPDLLDEMKQTSYNFAPTLWRKNADYRQKSAELMADNVASWLSDPTARARMPLFTAKYGDKLQPYLSIVDQTLPVKGPKGWSNPEPEEPAEAGGGGKPPDDILPPPPPPGSEFPKLPPPVDRTAMTADELSAQANDKMFGEGTSGAPAETFDTLMAKYVSEIWPAKVMDRMLAERGLRQVQFPKTMMWLSDMFRQTYGSDARAAHVIMHGGIRFGVGEERAGEIHFDKDAPSVVKAIQQIKADGGDLDGWKAWMVANRANDKERQGFNTGHPLSVEDRQKIIDGNRSKYETATNMLQKSFDSVLAYGRDSGVFNQGQVDAMIRDNPIYISFRRLMGDDSMAPRPKGIKGFMVREPVKSFEGSDAKIADPLLASMDNIRQIIRMSDRNRAVGSVVTLAKDMLGALGIKALPKPDVKAEIAGPNDEVFKPYLVENQSTYEPFLAYKSQRGDPNSNRFLYIDKGVPTSWSVKSPALLRLVRGADTPGEANIMAKAAYGLADLERAGLVTSPDFPTRVTWRHQITAFVLDPLHPPPFVTWLRGVMSAVNQDDTYWSWVRNGGAGVALQDMDDKYVSRNFDQVMRGQTGTLDKVINSVKHPLELAQIVGERMDAAARIGYYKSAIAKGYDPLKAATMGRLAYLDYAERGTLAGVQSFARMVPFFRPHLLGLKQGWEAISERPMETATYTAIAVTMPSVVLYAANFIADQFLPEDRKYANLPRWQKDNFYITPEIAGQRFRLQLPPNVGIPFGGFVNRALDHFAAQDPDAFHGWAMDLLNSYVPPFVPAAVKPFGEDWANKSFFTNRPIIPGALEGASGPMQYTPNTTGVAKLAARALGHIGIEASPVMMENYARDFTGTVGMGLLHALDAPFHQDNKPLEPAEYPFLSSFMIRNPGMGAQPIEEFFDQRSDLKKLVRDRQLAQARTLQGGSQQEFIEAMQNQPLGNVDGIANNLHALQSAIQDIQQRPTISADEYAALSSSQRAKSLAMTKDEKRQLTDTMYSDMIHLSKMGLETVAALRKAQKDQQ